MIFVIIGAGMAALGFMILFVGFLATGATRYKVYRAWRSRVGGRISCAVLMGITYLLNFVWSLILCFLVVVTFGSGSRIGNAVVPPDATGSRPASWQWLLQLSQSRLPFFLLPIEANASSISALAKKMFLIVQSKQWISSSTSNILRICPVVVLLPVGKVLL